MLTTDPSHTGVLVPRGQNQEDREAGNRNGEQASFCRRHTWVPSCVSQQSFYSFCFYQQKTTKTDAAGRRVQGIGADVEILIRYHSASAQNGLPGPHRSTHWRTGSGFANRRAGESISSRLPATRALHGLCMSEPSIQILGIEHFLVSTIPHSPP